MYDDGTSIYFAPSSDSEIKAAINADLAAFKSLLQEILLKCYKN